MFVYYNCLDDNLFDTEVTGRRGRKRKQLLDDPKEKRGCWKLKEGSPTRTLWRTLFVRDYGSVFRQTEWMSLYPIFSTLING